MKTRVQYLRWYRSYLTCRLFNSSNILSVINTLKPHCFYLWSLLIEQRRNGICRAHSTHCYSMYRYFVPQMNRIYTLLAAFDKRFEQFRMKRWKCAISSAEYGVFSAFFAQKIACMWWYTCAVVKSAGWKYWSWLTTGSNAPAHSDRYKRAL